MAGYIGSKIAVTQVDGYNRTEADAEFVQVTGDTMTGDLTVGGNATIGTDTGGILNVKGGSTTSAQLRFFDGGTGRARIGVPTGQTYLSLSGSDTLTADVAIDSSGKVGIGTTSPLHILDIQQDGGSGVVRGRILNTGTLAADSSVLQLQISGTTAESLIYFGDGSDSNAGMIRYDHASDYMSVHANAAERMRLDSSGGLRVGLTTNIFNSASSEKITVKNTSTGCAATFEATDVTGGYPILYLRSTDTAASQTAVYFYRTNTPVGSISTSASSTSYGTSSDYRLKENVTPLEGAADRLAQIPVHRFNFIADPDTTVDGFLAHEVQVIVPEAITGEKDAVKTVDVTDEDGNVIGTETQPVYQNIDQSKLVPLLTAALQEALQKIDALEARVAALEAA